MNQSKIMVCVSPSANPVSGKIQASDNDLKALQMARDINVHKRVFEIVSIGAMPDAAARDYWARGAETIHRLSAASEQIGDVVQAAAAQAQGAQWIFTGTRADAGVSGQEGSGMFPYLLGEALNLPVIDKVVSITFKDNALVAQQLLPKGARRSIEVSGKAIFVVHPAASVLSPFAPRLANSGQWIGTASGPEKSPVAQKEGLTAAVPVPPILKAPRKQSGHDRMTGAIGGAAHAGSGRIIKDGDAHAKAREVLDFLIEHGLFETHKHDAVQQ